MSNWLALADDLRGLGVLLGDPASDRSVSILESLNDGRIPDEYLNMLRVFNGFSESDFEPYSFVRVWSIEEVIDRFDNNKSLFEFADFAMDAVTYNISLNDDKCTIKSDRGIKIANSLYEFISEVASGKWMPQH